MLQQTQVDRVIPKWRAFLDAFPTWSDLAHAKQSDVLRLWKGLGYNRRALMLHRLAKRVEERGGELPNSITALRQLPGIGEYTANAIAAFAFRNADAAPVDTNIIRILTRIFPRQASTRRFLQELAFAIRPTDVWTWNHALMDIGALHCTARNHVSALCPLFVFHGNVEVREKRAGKVVARKSRVQKFEDTDRYFRGRIVDALREGPMRLSALRKRRELSVLENQRFATLVKGVVHDGLVGQRGNTVFLVGDE